MEYRILQNNLHDAHKVTKYCVGICCSQFLIILLLVFFSLSLSHRSMVTLVPMNLNEPMTVSNNAVSSDYLSKTAMAFINLRLNFNPETVDKNHKIILKFASTSSYPSLKKSLDAEAVSIKEQGISSNFYLNNVEINRKKMTIIAGGILMRSVSSKALPEIKTKFLIRFKNNNGLLSIRKFVEVAQNEK